MVDVVAIVVKAEVLAVVVAEAEVDGSGGDVIVEVVVEEVDVEDFVQPLDASQYSPSGHSTVV